MLQRYIRALADLSVNVKTYQPSISGAIARDELNTPVLCDCAKKCQQAFFGAVAGDELNNHVPSDCAKKCQ